MEPTRHQHLDVIVRPIETEKAESRRDDGVYVFEVAPKAGKLTIKKAVEAIWDVKVSKVRVVNMKGEQRRNRFKTFSTKGWRKAYVTLAEGDAIEI